MMNFALAHIQIDADADKREIVDAHNLITSFTLSHSRHIKFMTLVKYLKNFCTKFSAILLWISRPPDVFLNVTTNNKN